MADDSLRDVLNHLEFLGYQAEAEDESGWVFVSHPVRADFYIKAFPFGVRAVGMFRYDEVACDREWFTFVRRRRGPVQRLAARRLTGGARVIAVATVASA